LRSDGVCACACACVCVCVCVFTHRPDEELGVDGAEQRGGVEAAEAGAPVAAVPGLL